MAKKKTTQKTTGNTSGTSTTTPTAPSYLTDLLRERAGHISALGDRSGSDFVAGPSPLQQMGFDMIQSRMGGKSEINPVSPTRMGGKSEINPVSRTYGGDTGGNGKAQITPIADIRGGGKSQITPIAEVQGGGKSFITPIADVRGGYGDGQGGRQSGGYGAQNGLTGANGFEQGLGLAGAVAGAAPSYVRPTGGYNPSTYGGAQVGAAQGIDPARIGNVAFAQNGGGAAAGTAVSNLEAYRNPYTQEVIDTTMADFDESAGQTRAAQSGQMAATGAFGGSRSGIREAMTEGELARARSSLDAGLRSDAFNTAAGLASQDADRATTANIANAGYANDRSLYNAGAFNDAQQYNAGFAQQAGLFNAGEQNENSRLNAGYLQQAGLAGMDAQNVAARYNLDGQRADGQFNAGMREAGLNRQMSLADLLGDLQGNYDNSQRADIAQLLGAGETQRGIDQQFAASELALAELLGGLTSGLPANWVTGQTSNYTGQTSGTSDTTETGGLAGPALGALGSILAGPTGSIAGSIFGLGG